MIPIRLISCIGGICLLAACSPEPPARSVEELMQNEVLLEATLVRCTQNRDETRYEPDCVNVREAVNLIEAREEKARREQLEAQSQRKREALRRTQQAVAEARRRAAEEQKRREEAQYLAQFGDRPPAEDMLEDQALTGNAPTAEISEIRPEDEVDTDALPPLPGADENPELADNAEPAGDLGAVRDELKRRNEDGND